MDENSLISYKNVDVCRDDFLVLRNVNLEIQRGEFIYLIGKVGSGKSSLLKTLYKEVPIASGEARVLDYNLPSMPKKYIPVLRRHIGIVFQDFQLLMDRTVEKNLLFVLKATGWKDSNAMSQRIEEVLENVGMSNKGYKMPHELSGGEQQRIVMARAILNSPDIILADEPTGNLDPETGNGIVDLLHKISEAGATVIMSTHNLNFMGKFKGRVIKCENGQLIE